MLGLVRHKIKCFRIRDAFEGQNIIYLLCSLLHSRSNIHVKQHVLHNFTAAR